MNNKALSSAVVSEDGQLFSWGSGCQRQLGIDYFNDRLQPALVRGFEMFAARLVMPAAGDYHSEALASDVTVWTWGRGNGAAWATATSR
jgi:alpha-tubulin suppressor-like RCC1 family protein